MGKQMTIDDYLNDNNVAIMQHTGQTQEPEVIKPEPVNYSDLKKEDLIKILEQKDATIKSMTHELDKSKESHNIEIQNMNEYYQKKIKEMSHLVSYYERKLDVIKDIVTLETGGEK